VLSEVCKNSRNAGFKKCELLIVVKVIVAPLLQGRRKGGDGGGSNRVLVQRVPHPDGRWEERIFVVVVGVSTSVWNLQFVYLHNAEQKEAWQTCSLFPSLHKKYLMLMVLDFFLSSFLTLALLIPSTSSIDTIAAS
jgi:hypothetical protein